MYRDAEGGGACIEMQKEGVLVYRCRRRGYLYRATEGGVTCIEMQEGVLVYRCRRRVLV